MHKISNITGQARHGWERMAPAGFGGMSSRMHHDMVVPQAMRRPPPASSVPGQAGLDASPVNVSFNIPFSYNLPGPDKDEILHASPGALQRWTFPAGAADEQATHKLPVHVQNEERLRTLCQYLSDQTGGRVQAAVSSTLPKTGPVSHRKSRTLVTTVCISGDTELVYKIRARVLNETPIMMRSAIVDVDPDLILDGSEPAIRSSVLSHIDLCAKYTGTDIFLLKPKASAFDSSDGLASGVDSGLDQRYRINIFGDMESVEHAKTRALMMIDQILKHKIDVIKLDITVHTLVSGRTGKSIKLIESATKTAIYFPPPFPKVFGYVPPNATRRAPDEVFITGETQERINQAKQKLKELVMGIKLYAKDAVVSASKIDAILLDRLDKVRKIMEVNGSYVMFPALGTQRGLVRVQGTDVLHVERTVKEIMALAGQFYSASWWLMMPDPTQGPAIRAPSMDDIRVMLGDICANSSADLSFDKFTFNINGSDDAVKAAMMVIHQIPWVKTTPYQMRVKIELANEHKEFVSGKKNGKINKIMGQSNVQIIFDGFNEYNFYIDVVGSQYEATKNGLDLVEQEMPASISFHVPDQYHKRIIGIGGQHIQRIMKKYSVFVKFSNAMDRGGLGKDDDDVKIDNVICRTPARNAQSLDLVKQEIMDMVEKVDAEFVSETVLINRLYHRELIARLPEIEDLEKKWNCKIDFPSTEQASDVVVISGPEYQVPQAVDAFLGMVPESHEISFRKSADLETFLQSAEFASEVRQKLRDQYEVDAHVNPPLSSLPKSATASVERLVSAGQGRLVLAYTRNNAGGLKDAIDWLIEQLVPHGLDASTIKGAIPRPLSDSFADSLPFFESRLFQKPASLHTDSPTRSLFNDGDSTPVSERASLFDRLRKPGSIGSFSSFMSRKNQSNSPGTFFKQASSNASKASLISMESRESGYRNFWNDSAVNLPEEEPGNGGWPARFSDPKFPFGPHLPAISTPGDRTPKHEPRASFDSGRPPTSHSLSGYPGPIGPASPLSLRPGQIVQTQDGRQGVVRYIGSLHIASGDWVGLELPDNSGKNDGSVKGERYFTCPPAYGIFVRKESVVPIVRPANGGLAKPRLSTVNAADARKRQSLMSAAARSGGSTASRLSTMSPTKLSAASSAASTPRTGTPATTARTSDSSTKSRLSTAGGGRASMAPPAPPTKTAARPSVGGARGRESLARPSSISSRQSSAGPRPSVGVAKPLLRPASKPRVAAPARPVAAQPVDNAEPAEAENEEQEDAVDGPAAAHDHVDASIQPQHKAPSLGPQDQPDASSASVTTSAAALPAEAGHRLGRSSSLSSRSSRAPTVSTTVESRTADRREVETLKAKVRTLEKKALESRDRLKAVDGLQAEKDRFGAIIQTLQKKLKANSDEMAGLRAKYDEAEKRSKQGSAATDAGAEWESRLELANIDREMAEEKAAMHEAELDVLKARHEELELEMEILREENKELAGTMSAEERSSAGWIQLEKESERLRHALLLLRDHSQELEADLRGQIKELELNLDETDKVASKYNETAEKLWRMEEANSHLIEQLDTAEATDDIVVALQAEREQRDALIEQLQKQVQDYEEHIQVADELELFHVEEEKKLHQALDESEAVINEQDRRAKEQDKAIEDLEYSLTKFRDLVHGLQTDIESMRRDRDVSELQAHEMNSKSKAMMDLNLRLQSSATKTQVKMIDYEIGRMQAEQAVTQLEIVELFSHDGYDRMPVLALLCFKRIKSKAMLVKRVLTDRMRERPHLVQDDPFVVYEAMEKMSCIALCCDRFVQFIETCSPHEFTRYTGASVELEPVERSVTGWIDALKRDELGADSAEYLQRMVGILQDLAEKLIVDSNESKAIELISDTTLLESDVDSTASQLNSIIKAVQGRLGPPKDDNEDSLVLDKKMAQFGTKARTIRYLTGKVIQQLSDLRTSSMCVSEASWIAFEEARNSAQQVASFVRSLGNAVLADITNPHADDASTYSSITALMTTTAQSYLHEHYPRATPPDDIFAFLSSQLQSLQAKVEDLQLKASDINSCAEFEAKPAPWISRAKEIKAKKAIDRDIAQELAKLKRQAQEQVLSIAEKDRMIEEQKIKVHVLESRQKDSKESETETKMLKDQLLTLQAEKADFDTKLFETESRYEELSKQREADRAELDKLKATVADGNIVAAAGTELGQNNEMATFLKVQVDMLNSEILSLQSVVRSLKRENYALRVPVGEAALREERNAWLDPSNLRYGHSNTRAHPKQHRFRREAADLLDGLIDLATTAEPVKITVTVRQREEVEKWLMWKQDVIKRGKMFDPHRIPGAAATAAAPVSAPAKKHALGVAGGDDTLVGEVAIVSASP
ncbi:hypothetical protein DV736_g5806, partial [Chaetothyriales sp. CBS 134916]